MSQITLFLPRQEPAVVLGNVAPAVFEALGITDWEERDSSNYPPDDHYFVSHCANAEVIVCDADENRMPDFPIHVLVDEANWMKGGNSMSLDAPTIAKTLERVLNFLVRIVCTM